MEILSQIEGKYGRLQHLRRIHFDLARSYFHRNDFERALSELGKAEKISDEKNNADIPSDWEVHYVKGHIYEQINQITSAISEYLKAARSTEADKIKFYNKAHSLLTKYNASELKHIVESCDLGELIQDPESKKIIQDEFPGLLKNSNKAKLSKLNVLSTTDKIQLFVFWGRCFILLIESDQKNIKVAEILFLAAEKIDPNNPYVLEGLGKVYEFSSDINVNPVDYYERALLATSLELSRSIIILSKLVNLMIGRSEFDQARDVVKNHQRLFGGSIPESNYVKFLFLLIDYNSPSLPGTELYQKISAEIGNILSQIDSLTNDDNSELVSTLRISALTLLSKSLIILHEYDRAKTNILLAIQLQNSHEGFLLIKAQILIESQSDIEEGKEMLNLVIDEVQKTLPEIERVIQISRAGDANARLFLGFAYIVIKRPPEMIQKHVASIIELDLTPSAGPDGKEIDARVGKLILQGDLSYLLNDHKAAFVHYFDAGVGYSKSKHYSKACFHFSRSEELLESIDKHEVVQELKHFYFEYANAMHGDSIIATPPYYIRQKIEESEQLWNKSERKDLTEPNDYWYYEVIAFIHESMTNFVDDENWLEQAWKAILYQECALILNSNYHSLACLAHGYRMLDFEFTPKPILKKSIEEWSDYAFALEEAIINALNSGDFKQAKVYLEKVNKEAQGTPYYKKWMAFLYYYDKNYEQALSVLTSLILVDPDDLWSLDMILDCYWRKEDINLMRDFADKIWKRRNTESDKSNLISFSLAGVIIGEYEAAKDYATRLFRRMGPKLDSYDILIISALSENNLNEAQDYFNYFHKWILNSRVLDDLIIDLDIYRKVSKSLFTNREISDDKLAEILKEWTGRLKSKKEELSQESQTTPLHELKTEFERNPFKENSIPWVGFLAAEARILDENNSLEKSFIKYQRLLDFPDLFPQAENAVHKIGTKLLAEAETLVKAKNYELAKSKLDILAKHNSTFKAKYDAIMLIIFTGIDDMQAQSVLRRALTNLAPEQLDIFCSTLVQGMGTPKIFWKIFDNIQALTNDANEGNGILKDILTAISDYWFVTYGMNESDKKLNAVTPIIVELSNNLIPDLPGDELPAIKEYFPNMRNEIQHMYGGKIPGIRLRANADNISSYIIMINEIPVFSGQVDPNEVFVLATEFELKQYKIKCKPAKHPISNKDCVWIQKTDVPLIKGLPFEIWTDPIMYITSQLKAQLIRRLDNFHDIQYTEYYLQDLEESNSKPNEMALKIQSDEKLLIDFDKVLRHLLRERVSISNKEIIVEAFSGIDEDDEFSTKIKGVRLSLKENLPGNKPNTKRVLLPEEVEQKIQRELKSDNKKVFLGMKPEICQEVLADIRNLIEDYPSQNEIVLQVQSADLRPYVRALLELEFFDLMVIAKAELTFTNV